MMGRAGTNATIGAMHTATGLMTLGFAKAVQDGAQRAHDLRQVDRAHAIGRRYYAKRLAQRKAEALAEAEEATIRLMAMRKRLHG